jgi:hypothetical protein
VHLIEVGQFESIPENVLGAEKRALMLSVAVSTRNLFALLNVERRINAVDFPSRRELTNFGLLELHAHTPSFTRISSSALSMIVIVIVMIIIIVVVIVMVLLMIMVMFLVV